MKKQARKSHLAQFQKPSFIEAVYGVVSRIPKGKTLSYGEVARRAGFPGAARAVGTAMRKNQDTSRVPCHRVVRSDGFVGEYGYGGSKKKIARLKAEGVRISPAGRVLNSR